MHADLNACLNATPSGAYPTTSDPVLPAKPRRPATRRAWLLAPAVAALVLGFAGWQLTPWQRSCTCGGDETEASHIRRQRSGNRALARQSNHRLRDCGHSGPRHAGILTVARRSRSGAATSSSEIQWMPDGASVVVSGIQDDRLGLWIVPRLGGPARRLATRGAHLTVAPDGQWLALAMQNSQGFRVSPVDGGDDRYGEDGRVSVAAGPGLGREEQSRRRADRERRRHFNDRTMAPDGTAKRRLHTAIDLSSVRWSPIENVVYAIRSQDDLAEVISVTDQDQPGEPEVVLTGHAWTPQTRISVKEVCRLTGIACCWCAGTPTPTCDCVSGWPSPGTAPVALPASGPSRAVAWPTRAP